MRGRKGGECSAIRRESPTLWRMSLQIFLATSPKMNVPSSPSERVTLPPPLTGESRVAIAIPVRPSEQSSVAVMVLEWFNGSYEPEQVSLPFVTENDPSVRLTLFSP